MNSMGSLVAFLCVLMALSFCVMADSLKVDAKLSGRYEGMVIAGQPSLADVARLKASGITTIINLRGETEILGFDEASEVQAQGMKYLTLPVAGSDDINFTTAAAFRELFSSHKPSEVFVHCGTGNRVGALAALDAFQRKGVSLEEAISIGKQAGLTSLEDLVRERINQRATK